MRDQFAVGYTSQSIFSWPIRDQKLPFLPIQVISSVSLSDTLCKTIFSLRYSKPVAARGCLPSVDQDFPVDLLESFGVLGNRSGFCIHIFQNLTVPRLCLPKGLLYPVPCYCTNLGIGIKADETIFAEAHLYFCSVDLASMLYMPELKESFWS